MIPLRHGTELQARLGEEGCGEACLGAAWNCRLGKERLGEALLGAALQAWRGQFGPVATRSGMDGRD